MYRSASAVAENGATSLICRNAPESRVAPCGLRGQVVSGETPAERQDNWFPEAFQVAPAYGSGGSFARAQTPTLSQDPTRIVSPAQSSAGSLASLAHGEGSLP